jgi:hypothetical protein
MGSFDITDTAKTKWLQFDEDTEVCIQLITKPMLRDISKRAAKRAKLTGEDQGDIADKLLGRAAVKCWRKVGAHDEPGFIVNGQPFGHSIDNADLLMAKSLKFSRFVNDTCIDEDEFAGDSKNG